MVRIQDYASPADYIKDLVKDIPEIDFKIPDSPKIDYTINEITRYKFYLRLCKARDEEPLPIHFWKTDSNNIIYNFWKKVYEKEKTTNIKSS